MSAFGSGTYKIFTNTAERSVGRILAEDRSMSPKKVIVLPESAEPEAWTFDQIGKDQYILMAHGAHTAILNDAVWAILLDTPPAMIWKISPATDKGEGLYTIARADDPSQGWAAPSDDEESQQVLIKTLQGDDAEYFSFTPVE